MLIWKLLKRFKKTFNFYNVGYRYDSKHMTYKSKTRSSPIPSCLITL